MFSAEITPVIDVMELVSSVTMCFVVSGWSSIAASPIEEIQREEIAGLKESARSYTFVLLQRLFRWEKRDFLHKLDWIDNMW